MFPTIDTISVVCLTEDHKDGDLILDLMVDGINMVSYSVALFVLHVLKCIPRITETTVETLIMYKTGEYIILLFVLISNVYRVSIY